MHHEYKGMWVYVISEGLSCKQEDQIAITITALWGVCPAWKLLLPI